MRKRKKSTDPPILKLSLLHGCKNPWISVYIAWVTGYGYKIANCCRNNPFYLSAVTLTLSPLPSKPTTTARFYNAELRLYICMFDSLRSLSVEQYTSFISLLVHTVHLQEKIVCESFNSHIDAMGLPAQECYSISCYYFTAWRTTGLATLESSKRISSASIDKTSISAESTILAVVFPCPPRSNHQAQVEFPARGPKDDPWPPFQILKWALRMAIGCPE